MDKYKKWLHRGRFVLVAMLGIMVSFSSCIDTDDLDMHHDRFSRSIATGTFYKADSRVGDAIEIEFAPNGDADIYVYPLGGVRGVELRYRYEERRSGLRLYGSSSRDMFNGLWRIIGQDQDEYELYRSSDGSRLILRVRYLYY